MTYDRRRFVRTLTAAWGASFVPGASLVPGALAGLGRPDRAIAVLGVGEDTHYGRGALLGIEEGERAAQLLRSALRFEAYPAAGAVDAEGLVRRLDRGGALGVVSALDGGAQAELEGAATAAGLVALDARSVRPSLDPRPGVFRTGLPATVYGLALVEALTAARPRWRWHVRSEPGAPPSLVERVRRLVPHAARGGDVDTPPGGTDAVVRVGRASSAGAGPKPPSHAPTILIDPTAATLPPPVEGHRAALWDAGLFRYGAEQLNERYRRRFGTGMTGEAWAAWMAVKALTEATLRARGDAGPEATLSGARAAFDGHKGVPLAFTGPGGTLAQPLYVIANGETRQVDWLESEGDR